MLKKVLHYPQLPSLLLRIGLAFIFIYAAVASFINPREWIGFLPPVLTNLVNAELLLHIFSILELVLAAWLLSGVYVWLAALLAFLMLGGIVTSNFQLFAISFRDISLMCSALALALIDYNNQANPRENNKTIDI